MSNPAPHRYLLFGNSGSGKTTMARALVKEHGLVHLDLDSVAWSSDEARDQVRRPACPVLPRQGIAITSL